MISANTYSHSERSEDLGKYQRDVSVCASEILPSFNRLNDR